MTNFKFVEQTGIKDADQKTSTAVRRHVMVGKNRGRTPRTPRQPTVSGALVFNSHENVHDNDPIVPTPPRQIASDLEVMEFADVVKVPLRDQTLRFCTTMNSILFRLAPYIAFDTTNDNAVCLQPLLSDALYLNIMVFGAQTCIDLALNQDTAHHRQNSPKDSLQHYGKALSLLRLKLSETASLELATSDSVIVAIYTLAMHALIMENYQVAKNHMIGLSRLVSMNERGIHSFRGRTRQMMELIR